MAVGSFDPESQFPHSRRELLKELDRIRDVLEQLQDRVGLLRRLLALRLDGRGGNAGPAADPGVQRSDIAESVNRQERPDGSLEVRINHGKTFVLPPRLAQVFVFLATVREIGDDSLIGWRSRQAVAGFLQKKNGKQFRPQYINNLIERLKRTLHAHGYDQKLIQSDRELGVRLAWKRTAGTVIGGSDE